MEAVQTSQVTVRVMRLSDLPYAQSALEQFLPGGFFVDLGRRFRSTYLRTYMTSPFGCGLVAEVDGQTVGFLVGSVEAKLHRAHLLQADKRSLMVRGALAMAARPRVALRFLRTRVGRYAKALRRSGTPAPTVLPADRTGVLAHIAVSTGWRGLGVGEALVTDFLAICSAHDTGVMELVTAEDNKPALRFYGRLGWKVMDRTTDAEGKTWVTLGTSL